MIGWCLLKLMNLNSYLCITIMLVIDPICLNKSMKRDDRLCLNQ